MTEIFRYAPVDAAPFARGTFWTMFWASAENVARVEAGSPDLPPGGCLYRAEVIVVRGENLAPDESVEALLHSLRATPDPDRLPQIRDALLRRGEHFAARFPWVQFTGVQGASWEGAMLYMGDEPIPPKLMPETPD
jgi:hypothetical protein